MDGIVLRLRTADGEEVMPAPRLGGRFGRLASPVVGAERAHVRCACDECGAHLLGIRAEGGGATGVCLVCGGVAVRPL